MRRGGTYETIETPRRFMLWIKLFFLVFARGPHPVQFPVQRKHHNIFDSSQWCVAVGFSTSSSSGIGKPQNMTSILELHHFSQLFWPFFDSGFGELTRFDMRSCWPCFACLGNWAFISATMMGTFSGSAWFHSRLETLVATANRFGSAPQACDPAPCCC